MSGVSGTRFYTAGHSTRSLSDFLQMLAEAEAGLLIDVRRFPHSPRFPRFGRDSLPDSLESCGIEYLHCAALGGRRSRSEPGGDDRNAWWRNASFHNYADYALTAGFQKALDAVIGLGRSRRSVLMCSEAVWWRCHRRIISDHLLARGHEVVHLIAPGRCEHAELTEGAVVNETGCVIYPA